MQERDHVTDQVIPPTGVRSEVAIEHRLGTWLWSLHALIYVWTLRRALAHASLGRTRRWLGILARCVVLPNGPQTVRRAREAVDRASTCVHGGDNCLVRALTLHTLLAHRKIPSEVRIGFAATATGVKEGHAWLEHEGRVLIGEIRDLDTFRLCGRPY